MLDKKVAELINTQVNKEFYGSSGIVMVEKAVNLL